MDNFRVRTPLRSPILQAPSALFHSLILEFIVPCGMAVDSWWFSCRLYFSSVRYLLLHHNVIRGFLGLKHPKTFNGININIIPAHCFLSLYSNRSSAYQLYYLMLVALVCFLFYFHAASAVSAGFPASLSASISSSVSQRC